MFLLPTSSQATELCEEAFCLSATPEVCIVQRAGDRCEQELRVHWIATEIQPLCLSLQGEALACWSDVETGSYQEKIDWPQHGELALTNAHGQPLISLELSIQSLRPRQRRRLGSPWSVF
ncbi:DUF3019 domain-containing protein [Aliidiomarina sanyensis]|uniref:DUF3019 domain-containing protein n=1 Tax=Aliidiomarina sanyensis TaxID=1249555 RepID=UPI0013009124|nr:DUF3019 domain-containing protein [Aliidiomarina sanyensis]